MDAPESSVIRDWFLLGSSFWSTEWLGWADRRSPFSYAGSRSSFQNSSSSIITKEPQEVEKASSKKTCGETYAFLVVVATHPHPFFRSINPEYQIERTCSDGKDWPESEQSLDSLHLLYQPSIDSPLGEFKQPMLLDRLVIVEEATLGLCIEEV